MPLINFFHIQDLVRSGGALDVNLVEVPENGTDYYRFPCTLDLHTLAEINDFGKSFSWDFLNGQPIMFWRLPEISEFVDKKKPIMRNGNYLPKFTVSKKKEVFLKPRGLIYQDGIEFSNIRAELGMLGKLPLQVNRLYSGDIVYSFRFRVIGISNIESLFFMYEQEIYYNGARVPKFITHHPGKKVVRQGEKRIVDYLRPLAALSDKGTKVAGYKYKEAKEFMQLDYLDLTTQGSAQLEDMKRYFKLPFKPYLIFLRCMVFAGTKMLAEVKDTPPVSFANNPNVNLAIVFKELMVSQLPLEVL